MDFKLVIFDWDGTLSDSNAHLAHCAHAACVDMGMAAPEGGDLRAVLGLDIGEAAARLFPHAPPSQRTGFIQRFRQHHAQGAGRPALFPGTLQMLQALASDGFLLALATSAPRALLTPALSRAPSLADLFHGSRTAEETASKPDPRMLFELMREAGVPPSRTLMVGDTVHDLRMSANAGVRSVGVCHDPAGREALQALGPLHVASDADGLHRWLMENLAHRHGRARPGRPDPG